MKTNRNTFITDSFFAWSLLKLSLTVFMLLFFIKIYSYPLSQSSFIDLRMENTSLKKILVELRNHIDYDFIYSDKDISGYTNRSVIFSKFTIDDAMKELLLNTNLTYKILDNTIVIKQNPVKQQKYKRKLYGMVLDKDKEPIVGATVLVKGTNIGAATDLNGKYVLEFIDNRDSLVLVFSFLGMQTKELIVKDRDENNIIMQYNINTIDNTVITGMFSRKPEGFTGSSVKIKGEDIKKFSTTSIVKAISAIDPSFRIMDDISMGSDPNRLPDLRMRGSATLPTGHDNDLVTLKGEYATYPNQPLLIMDGFEISLQAMVDLDPDRVASISLLKDAAATAIYGARAANGVIVIETKSPQRGKLIVNYSGNFRFEIPDLTSYNLMNASEKLEAEKLAGFYPNDSDIHYVLKYNEYLREVERGVNTYWLSQPLRTAIQHRHSVSIEGGDRVLRYKLYAGANFTPGVMKESSRNTINASLDLLYRFRKIRFRNSISVDEGIGNNSPWGTFSDYSSLNPYLRVYGDDGKILKNIQRPNSASIGALSPIPNPMYNTTFNSKDRNTSFSVRNVFRIEYDPIPALKTQLDFSILKSVGKTEIFKPSKHTLFMNITDPTLRGSFLVNNSEALSYRFGIQASFDKSIYSTHFITSNIRLTLGENDKSSYGATATGFPNENMDNILFGKKYNEKIRGIQGTSRNIGFIGMFGYSYEYKYSLDFNIRIDGSSQFGENNRFAPFWSAGFRWNAKKEDFFKSINYLSNLVFRLSHGITGTQGFAPYQAQQLYTYNNLMMPHNAFDGSGVELVGLGNSELKWQKTNQTNVGIEFGFWDNRLTGRLEYYEKITVNSLTDITLAPSVGFSTIPENLGSIKNRGVEFMFSCIPLREISKNMLWVININGSHNTDKIVKISDALRHMNERNANSTKNAPLPQFQEGGSQSDIWVVKSLGIDPSTGNEIFERRVSKDITGIWNATDLQSMGNYEPFVQGNINSSFSYKGFGLNIGFTYRMGGDVYNTTLLNKLENANLRNNAYKGVLYDRWKKPGDVVRFKRLVGNEISGTIMTNASSRFIVKENMLRFSSLSFSYRLDTSNSNKLKKYRLTSFSAGITMEDIFYLSTVEQERGLNYPFARQFSLNLQFTF